MLRYVKYQLQEPLKRYVKYQLQEPLKWAVLKGNQNNFSMTVREAEMQSLLYGISMETKHSSGETVSSGILWNNCIYRKNRSNYFISLCSSDDMCMFHNYWVTFCEIESSKSTI